MLIELKAVTMKKVWKFSFLLMRVCVFAFCFREEPLKMDLFILMEMLCQEA